MQRELSDLSELSERSVGAGLSQVRLFLSCYNETSICKANETTERSSTFGTQGTLGWKIFIASHSKEIDMAYLIIAYPELSQEDYWLIQEFRKQNDFYYSIVEPHFTIVFPVFDIEKDLFINPIDP